MISLRPKLGSERNKEWRCCFCLHVRTGTILLGTWHLMLHLIALGFLAAIVRDPRLLDDLERDSDPVADWGNLGHEAMPTALSKIEPPPSSYTPLPVGQIKDHSLIYHDVDVGALVTVCTLAITFMLIYGASLGKPAHLLPFFCLQIFDFAITVLTATGYLCYLSSIKSLVAQTRRVPWRDELLQLPPAALAIIVLIAFLLAVLIKGYCISIVWRCYKYLTMRSLALSPFVVSSEEAVVPAHMTPYTAPVDYTNMLPDYEEAVKQTPPPPSYRAATLMSTNTPTLTTVQERSQNNVQPPAAPQPTNTMVVLPQHGSQSSV